MIQSGQKDSERKRRRLLCLLDKDMKRRQLLCLILWEKERELYDTPLLPDIYSLSHMCSPFFPTLPIPPPISSSPFIKMCVLLCTWCFRSLKGWMLYRPVNYAQRHCWESFLVSSAERLIVAYLIGAWISETNSPKSWLCVFLFCCIQCVMCLRCPLRLRQRPQASRCLQLFCPRNWLLRVISEHKAQKATFSYGFPR